MALFLKSNRFNFSNSNIFSVPILFFHIEFIGDTLETQINNMRSIS